MRRGLAGLLGLPESLFDHSGKGSSPMPAADYLGQQDDQQQQQAAPGGLRRHGSGIPLPPPPPLDASLVRSLSGVPCPPSPTKPPAADGLARQFSGLPLAAALAEAAAGPKTRKRARTARPRQAATAAAAAAVAEEADEPMDEAEQKRHARLMKNRQTAAASRWAGWWAGGRNLSAGGSALGTTRVAAACLLTIQPFPDQPPHRHSMSSSSPHPPQAAPPGPHRLPGGAVHAAGGGAGPVRHPGEWVHSLPSIALMH